jgi:hypothetical protein
LSGGGPRGQSPNLLAAQFVSRKLKFMAAEIQGAMHFVGQKVRIGLSCKWRPVVARRTRARERQLICHLSSNVLISELAQTDGKCHPLA